MGLVVGIVVAVGTLALCFLFAFANGMSDAPSQSGISIGPYFFGGMAIAGLLIASHYLHWTW